MTTDPLAAQIAAAIREEADYTSRPGQYARLNALADDVERFAARLDDGLRAGVEALAAEAAWMQRSPAVYTHDFRAGFAHARALLDQRGEGEK